MWLYRTSNDSLISIVFCMATKPAGAEIMSKSFWKYSISMPDTIRFPESPAAATGHICGKRSRRLYCRNAAARLSQISRGYCDQHTAFGRKPEKVVGIWAWAVDYMENDLKDPRCDISTTVQKVGFAIYRCPKKTVQWCTYCARVSAAIYGIVKSIKGKQRCTKRLSPVPFQKSCRHGNSDPSGASQTDNAYPPNETMSSPGLSKVRK